MKTVLLLLGAMCLSSVAAMEAAALNECLTCIENGDTPQNAGEGFMLALNPAAYFISKRIKRGQAKKRIEELKKRPSGFEEGKIVKLVNLEKHTHLNGETGMIIGFAQSEDGVVDVKVQMDQRNKQDRTITVGRGLIRDCRFGMGQVVTFRNLGVWNGDRAIVNYYTNGKVNVQPIGSRKLRFQSTYTVPASKLMDCSTDYFKVGKTFKLHGLSGHMDLNGKEVTVVSRRDGPKGDRVTVTNEDMDFNLTVPTSMLRLQTFPHRATYHTAGKNYAPRDLDLYLEE